MFRMRDGLVALERLENDVLLIRLAGRWQLRNGLVFAGAPEAELGRVRPSSRVTFDTHQLGDNPGCQLPFRPAYCQHHPPELPTRCP
jgi:hypothetical protein